MKNKIMAIAFGVGSVIMMFMILIVWCIVAGTLLIAFAVQQIVKTKVLEDMIRKVKEFNDHLLCQLGLKHD